MYKLHCTVVNQHMFQSYFRIILCDFFYNFSPESGRIQYVCLVNACDFLSSLHGNIKCLDGNTTDLIFIIGKCIDCFLYTIFFNCFSFSEIKTAGKLTDNDHVKSVFPDHFFLDRAGFLEFFIQVCRTKVCKKIQCFTNCKKSCFRTFGRLKFVPRRCPGITTDRTHQNCIRSFCCCNCFICKRYAVNVNRSSAEKHL